MKNRSCRLETAWCRTCQCGLKLANYAMGYRTPQCIEGPGALSQLPGLLKNEQINDVLLVTGASLLRRGMAEPLLRGMEQEGIRCTVLTLENPDPTSRDVELGYRMYREHGCKAIVALGGGSRIDCAKGIAAKAARPNKTVPQLQGLLNVRKAIPPFVAIPTTAGAGSETTVAAVITDVETHRKAAINDPCLIPKYVVLDPTLTVGLNPYTTATTGMDALAHAVGHTLGGLYGVAHGFAMAVLLPHVMRQYGAATHRRLAELAEVCGIPGTTDAEKAERFLSWVEETNRQMGLPDKFDVIREEDIPQMIAWARKEANPLYPVPVVWGEEEFRRLIEQIRA